MVANIQSHISSVATLGNPELAGALTRLLDATLADPDPTPDNRTAATELIEGITTEADQPPEGRSAGRIRAFLNLLPALLRDGKMAFDVYNEVEPIIQTYLPH